jgi:hypothetical protein
VKQKTIILEFGKTKKRKKRVEAAKLLIGKTPRHCHYRYKIINPHYKKGLWAKQEDELLLNYISLLGYNWSTISKLMKTRKNKQIHNRFKILFGKRNTQNKCKCVNKANNADDNENLHIQAFNEEKKVLNLNYRKVEIKEKNDVNGKNKLCIFSDKKDDCSHFYFNDFINNNNYFEIKNDTLRNSQASTIHLH